ncbi:multicopper oxidase family protein [Paenibacillus methanolicus]|uniref:Multicopper oxidase n=1 Tax=Paenibacillus methanolicus TaxID=582686 RepID=A0A5S5BYN2_9BACL|nr:multicopper oxidase domain-containing protein [Paenibacillus methanolicus]TYP70773.1 multicopper oxidase [Paenibacillus methanolicus]
MYSLFVGLTLGAPLLLLALGWIAGTKASRLVYSGSAPRMRRKARKLITWTFILTLPVAAQATGAVLLMQRFEPVYWQDRAFILAPMTALPLLAAWFVAVPKLLLLRRELSRHEAEAPLSGETLGRASQPGIVAPFQALAWSGTAVFLLSMTMAAPFDWVDAGIPVAAVLLVWYGLWAKHRRRSRKIAVTEAPVVSRPWRSAAAGFGVALLLAAIAAPLGYLARETSLLPVTVDMASGPADLGGGTALAHAHGTEAAAPGAVSVSDLTGPRDGEPDQRFTLTAEKKTVQLSSGKSVEAWTFNGQIPGPQLRMKQGELIEVTLVNKDIEGGATIHWHGLDVPNAEDGVAGATQNAVMPGESHTYRFIAEQTGTYWYHSHQHSREAVAKGLFGSLIVDPASSAEVSERGSETFPDTGVVTDGSDIEQGTEQNAPSDEAAATEQPDGNTDGGTGTTTVPNAEPTLPAEGTAPIGTPDAPADGFADHGTGSDADFDLDEEGLLDLARPKTEDGSAGAQPGGKALPSVPNPSDTDDAGVAQPTNPQPSAPKQKTGDTQNQLEAGTPSFDLETGDGATLASANAPSSEGGFASAPYQPSFAAEAAVTDPAGEETTPADSLQGNADDASSSSDAALMSTTTEEIEDERDFTVMTHLWGSTFAIGANDGIQRFDVPPGTPVRLRLINTDDWIRQSYMLTGTAFRVDAIDGGSVNEPSELRDVKVTLTTGARYDLTFDMPEGPVFLSIGGRKDLGIFLSPDGQGELPAIPAMEEFDPLHYGQPATTPFDAASAFDRSFDMIIDNKLGFYNGAFDQLYTMNGESFPNTPMYMVREGELVKITIVNRSLVDHPMHLHGHHALVLSRNGEAADGSPWWTDTLDVLPGETYEIAFRADNPGLWMDHCHNLLHAKAGMSMHLMYEGVLAPYTVGSATQNHPE